MRNHPSDSILFPFINITFSEFGIQLWTEIQNAYTPASDREGKGKSWNCSHQLGLIHENLEIWIRIKAQNGKGCLNFLSFLSKHNKKSEQTYAIGKKLTDKRNKQRNQGFLRVLHCRQNFDLWMRCSPFRESSTMQRENTVSQGIRTRIGMKEHLLQIVYIYISD